jgi:hypothetical protein
MLSKVISTARLPSPVRIGGFAGKIGHDPDHEGQLHRFLRPVGFNIIFDLHPRRAVAGDEFLATGFGHRVARL